MFSLLPFLRYMLFNLCSEKTYDTSFFHGRVERVHIDDHNVPSLQQMLEFANKVPGDENREHKISICTGLLENSRYQFKADFCGARLSLFSCKKNNKQVREWLGQHPDNVIVVHCKVRSIMT